MEPVVLVHHHKRPRKTARELALAALELFQDAPDDARAHLVAVLEHVPNERPVLVLLRHLRVVVALVGVVHARVDPALERRQVAPRADGSGFDQAREEDVREGGQVADVEERLVPEVDGLGVQELRRDHVARDEVPDPPSALELVERGEGVRVRGGVEGGGGCGGKEGEGESRALEDVQRGGG